MERELHDWLDSYLKYTEQSEPPTSYHTWCGLSVIGAALQRKVHLQWGFETLYPNLFVVLVGPSGRARKGVALGIAKDMLGSASGVAIAPESSSREALILAMKRNNVNFQDPVSGKIRFHCSIAAFSEELSVLLGQKDIKLLANLTDWYDSKNSWSYETVGRGRDALEGVCVTLVGATAPDWLQSMLPPEAIGGGFTSRVIFVVEERKGKTVAKHEITDWEKDLHDQLARDLQRINTLAGTFAFTPSGERAYIEWYEEQDKMLALGQMAVPDARFSGYCERRTTHLRKLMMILSASRGDSLELDLKDFVRAKATLEHAEIKMGMTFGGLGKSVLSESTQSIMDFIKQMRVVSRSSLLTKFFRDIDANSLRQVEEALQQMKVVEVNWIPDKNEKFYKWIGQ